MSTAHCSSILLVKLEIFVTHVPVMSELEGELECFGFWAESDAEIETTYIQ